MANVDVTLFVVVHTPL